VGGGDRQRRLVQQHQPGITFFANLNKIGNFVPGGTAATAAAGTTPILIWWDYLQNGVAASVPGWKSVIPSDGTIAAYYTQAITKDAPDPAAARLWEEFLYSTLGQNLFLQGYARPIELPGMIANHTVNEGFLAKLPAAPKGTLTFPTHDRGQQRQGDHRGRLGLGNQR
jgi:putative spermidine/putrescine transport system substrate-binding protein